MGGAALWLGILAGLAAAAQVGANVARRLRQVKEAQNARARQVRDTSQAVREKARTMLELKREQRGLERELARLTREIEGAEETLARHKDQDRYIYVFDERRNVGDHPFIVPIRHPDFGHQNKHVPPEVRTSWADGRRFLVWAQADRMAQAKAAMRFPADRGYQVGPAEPFDTDADEL